MAFQRLNTEAVFSNALATMHLRHGAWKTYRDDDDEGRRPPKTAAAKALMGNCMKCTSALVEIGGFSFKARKDPTMLPAASAIKVASVARKRIDMLKSEHNRVVQDALAVVEKAAAAFREKAQAPSLNMGQALT
jgi:hypothetical protein